MKVLNFCSEFRILSELKINKHRLKEMNYNFKNKFMDVSKLFCNKKITHLVRFVKSILGGLI